MQHNVIRTSFSMLEVRGLIAPEKWLFYTFLFQNYSPFGINARVIVARFKGSPELDGNSCLRADQGRL